MMKSLMAELDLYSLLMRRHNTHLNWYVERKVCAPIVLVMLRVSAGTFGLKEASRELML